MCFLGPGNDKRDSIVNMRRVLVFVVMACLLAACGPYGRNGGIAVQVPSFNATATAPAVPADLMLARQKIRHVVIIMQENRSFDSYFGTYPGADGLPVKNGKFTVCVNDPATGKCIYPFHDPNDLNYGGPHNATSAAADIGAGRMDGFIAQAEHSHVGCQASHDPSCGAEGAEEVMGYHDAREIPNYWTLAENFVLQAGPAANRARECANPLEPAGRFRFLSGPSPALDIVASSRAWASITAMISSAV
jgi:hypothetical protein